MISVLRQIGTQWKYTLLALSVSSAVFSFAIWLPNMSLIVTVVSSQTLPWYEKLSFVWSLYGSIRSNFSLMSATYTIGIALLTGMNVALLTYYIRRVRGGVRSIANSGVTGITGLASGVFGIGCASCGTLVIASVLAVFGALGVLSILPFGGEEFGILGMLLLGYATYTLIKKINAPLVCSHTPVQSG